MLRLQIAMGLIRQGDSYALQLRNGKQQAGGLNLIGCFGGQIEPGETAKMAACREVAEESSLRPKARELEFLGRVKVRSERHNQPIMVEATIYLIEITGLAKLEAREGELVIMIAKEIRANLDKLTPATRACFEQLIKD